MALHDELVAVAPQNGQVCILQANNIEYAPTLRRTRLHLEVASLLSSVLHERLQVLLVHELLRTVSGSARDWVAACCAVRGNEGRGRGKARCDGIKDWDDWMVFC